MAKCKTDAVVGDTLTTRDGDTLVVVSVQTGTAHGCLYVGETRSAWDFDVTHVNGEPVT